MSKFEAGTTIKALAAEYRIGRTTVQGHLDRRGIVREPLTPKLDGSTLATAVEIYASGKSLKAIGDALQVDAKTVSRALRKAGVEPRPRPGWSRA